jgi:hypothetical protein
VAGRYLQAARAELGTHDLGFVQMGANRLDMEVAGLFDSVQDTVKLAQRAQRVQLD